MWLPGAGVGGEDLTAKCIKGAKKRGLTTKAKGSDIILLNFVNFVPSW